MRLQKLTVKGFEAAADEVRIDFSDKNMVAFVGENGTGKSMLSLWAVIFALYGKTRHRTINESISTSSGQAFAELEFTLNNTWYRVIRKLPRIGAHEATLEVYNDTDQVWEIIENKNPSSTNQAIIDLLGMNFDAAKTTFMALQGEYGLFCESKPSDRRLILTQLLGLENYEVFHKSADEKLKDANTEALGYESQLNEMSKLREIVSAGDPEFETISDEELDEELAELVEEDQELQQKEAALTYKQDNAEAILRDAELAKQKFEKDKAEKIAFYEQSVETLRAENSYVLSELEQDAQKISEAKLHHKTTVDSIENLKKRIAAGEEKIAATEEALSEIKEEGVAKKSLQTSLITQREELQEQKKSLKTSSEHGATCVTCNQSLSEELVAKVLQTITDKENETVKELKSTENSLNDLKTQYSAKDRECKEFKKFLNELQSNLLTQSQKLATLKQIISREEEVKNSLEREYENQKSRAVRLEKAEKDLASVKEMQLPSEILQDIELAEKNLNAALEDTSQVEFDYSGRQRMAKIEKERATRENIKEKEAAFDSRKLDLERKLDHAKKDIDHYTMLRKAFAPTGIPAMILAGVIPELEQDANEYLDKFSQGEMSLNIETERIHKKGTKAEEILITVNAADGTREYHSFSGGQKFRIDLAIRIAMCKVAARRTGSAAIETLFIDEGFGSLDSKGTMSTLSALTELSQEMSVVAVSHIDGVKESFPDLVQVSIDSGTTTINELKSSMVA